MQIKPSCTRRLKLSLSLAQISIASLLSTSATAASQASHPNPPPIQVIIIAVPSVSGMGDAYKNSPIGEEAVKVCGSLEAMFRSHNVAVEPLCTPEKTKWQYIRDYLTRYRETDQRGRLTLLFFMTHGEKSPISGDVKLLLTDTTPETLSTRSQSLQELAHWLLDSRDSTAVAFVDACYSGAIDSASFKAASALAALDDGVHAGLMASSQPNKQSYMLAFTKALMRVWSDDSNCPANDVEFQQAVASKMADQTPDPQQPRWIMSYHASPCFHTFLNPNKLLYSIWFDPSLVAAIRITKDGKALQTIPTNPGDPRTYFGLLARGDYTFEAVPRGSARVDSENCYQSQTFCSSQFPQTPNRQTLDVLRDEVKAYDVAKAVGFNPADLSILQSRVGLLYGSVKEKDPDQAILATNIIQKSPDLSIAVKDFESGNRTPFEGILATLPADTKGVLTGALSSISKGNSKAAAKEMKSVGKALDSTSMKDASAAVNKGKMTPKTLDKIEGAVKSVQQ